MSEEGSIEKDLPERWRQDTYGTIPAHGLAFYDPSVFPDDVWPPGLPPRQERYDFLPEDFDSNETGDRDTSVAENHGRSLSGDPATLENVSTERTTSVSEASQPDKALGTSLKEHVRPGQSKRDHFPLIPSKVALLIIDMQEYLSTPRNVQDEEADSYFYRSALPRTLDNVERLLSQLRQQRDSQCQGCEVIFTYLEALTRDCRDISLDYKLSGPQLASLPNAVSAPAIFLESVPPIRSDGKGDIMIPKTSCSVFMSTNMHYVLQNLHIEQLLVCGQLTDQCVESAVRDAADLGYFVTVIEDSCAAKSENAHQKGLSGMKGFSRILSTEQVLEELQNPQDTMVLIRNVAPEPSQGQEINPQLPSEKATRSHLSIIPATKWKAPGCDKDGAAIALLHTLQFAGVKFVRYMTVDVCNSIRSKAVPLHRLAQSGDWNHQVSIAKVCFAGLPSYGDCMMEATGLDARNILTLQPDLSTLTILPYALTSSVVMGIACDPSRGGSVSPLCSRGLLMRVTETAKQHGIHFVSMLSSLCVSHGKS